MRVTRLILQVNGIMGTLLLVGLLGCSKSTPTPTGDTKSTPTPTGDSKQRSGDSQGKPGPTDQPHTPKAGKLTADEFGKEWLADKAGTVKKYADTLLEVTGRVDRFSIDLGGKPLVLIPCGPEKKLLLNVNSKQKEPWAAVGPGQQVTVRGKLNKVAFEIPYLEDAEFVNPGPSTSIVLTAADLAAEASKSFETTVEKYKGKGVIVVGKVVRRNVTKSIVFLDGGDKKVIESRTELVLGPALGVPLEEGKDARVYGVVRNLPPLTNDAVLEMGGCLPILERK